ncbi:MAG: SDR family NAD(P)-dependent oxidoreductase [Pseudomonadota bacterium]
MTKPDFDCRNRTVVVSGAGRGLGAAFCEVFAALGANLGLIDLDEESLETTCARLRASGARCHAVRVSVADSDAVLAAVREIESELGPVHTLVNNAGITHIQNFHAEQVARARTVVDVNLMGAINLTGACFDSIRSQAGAIVAISSVAGYAPLVGRTAYAASKHGLHGFFETLRLELRNEPVKVLLACPSFIATDIRRDQQTEESNEDGRSRTVGKDMSPYYVASAIVRALQAGKTEIQVGRIAVLSRLVRRLAPRLYERLMLRRIKDEP